MSLGWPFKLIIDKVALSDRNEKLTETISGSDSDLVQFKAVVNKMETECALNRQA
jgi:hypothetical protein